MHTEGGINIFQCSDATSSSNSTISLQTSPGGEKSMYSSSIEFTRLAESLSTWRSQQQQTNTQENHFFSLRPPPPPNLLFPHLWLTPSTTFMDLPSSPKPILPLPDKLIQLSNIGCKRRRSKASEPLSSVKAHRNRILPEEESEGDVDEDDDDEDDQSRSDTMNVECVVCGDKSSGKHYGQYTCEGCKSFFKRSVRRKLKYTCRGNKQCPVDIHHRNQCQHCRFQKCIKTGMRKEAVQQGRLSSFGSIYYPYFGMGGLSGLGSPATMQSGNFSALSISNPVLNNGKNQSPSSEYSQFISHLLKAESPTTSTTTRMGLDEVPVGTVKGMSQFQDVCVRLLFSHVEWIRRVPYFNSLHLQDQLTLLQTTWPDIFLMNLAQFGPLVPSLQDEALNTGLSHCRSTVEEKEDLYGANGSSQHRLVQEKHESPCKDDCKQLQKNINRIKALQMDPVEYSCIKTLLLFNPGADQLIDPIAVECIQTKTQAALEEYFNFQFPHQNPLRFGQLVLRVLGFKQISRELFSRIMRTQKSVDSILVDLLTSTLIVKPDPFKIAPTTTRSLDDRYDIMTTPWMSQLNEKPAIWTPSFSSPKQGSSPDFATHFQALQRECHPKMVYNLSRTNNSFTKIKPEIDEHLHQLPNGAFDPVFNRVDSFSTYYHVLQNHLNKLNPTHPT